MNGIKNYDDTEFTQGNPPIIVRVDKKAKNGPMILDSFHTHSFLQLCVVAKGSADHFIIGKKVIVTVGDVFVIPPNTPHKLDGIENEELHIYKCQFMPTFLSDNINGVLRNSEMFDYAYIKPFMVEQSRVRSSVKLNGSELSLVNELLLDMIEEQNKKSDGYLLVLKADLLRLLVTIGRAYAKPSSDKDIAYKDLIHKYKESIFKAIDFVDKNFNDDIKLKDVCVMAEMSQTNFCRVFKLITGQTFIEYINSIRIKMAMDLIEQTKLPLTQICYDVGFRDFSNFYKTCKRITGFSPKMFRN